MWQRDVSPGLNIQVSPPCLPLPSSSSSSAKYLEGLDGAKGIKVDVLKRGKDEAQNKKLWGDVVARIGSAGSGKTIGHFPKDQAIGKVAEEWLAYFNGVKSEKDFKEVDVGPAMGVVWGAKDADELVSHILKVIEVSGCCA